MTYLASIQSLVLLQILYKNISIRQAKFGVNRYFYYTKIVGTIVTTIDRDWKDTWHVGGALAYDFGENHRVDMGISYDSSPVSNKDRTADLPLDEQIRVAAAYGKINPIGLSYSFSTSYFYFGKGKMDQTAQGERFKGEFDTNYLIFIAASVNYRF